MSASHVLAIDQGTTNSKALILSREGRVVASASRPVAISYPRPAWVEQDPETLWQTVREAMDECIAAAGVEIAALGIANQRESVVVWERKTGVPLGPCVVWQCRRSAPLCDDLRSRGLTPFIQSRTGLGIDPLFSASKARWLLDQVPDGLRRAADGDLCIGTVDSWICWKLTCHAVHACDLTNASRTQMLNLRELVWDPEMLGLFGIPRAALPELRPSSAIVGETAAGIPVASLIGDSHGALFGHAIFSPGAVKATYGTGSSLMTLTAGVEESRAGLSATIGWSLPGDARYALEGNIANTGGTVQWLGEFLRLDDPAAEVAELARSVADSGGVYLVPAFVGLGAPYWSSDARALLTGMTRGTTAAHAARAAIDSIAFQVRDVFEAMERDTGRGLPVLLADGGAARNDDLMQFQAGILGRRVVRNNSEDLSATGAAWLAGLAVGLWQSPEELASLPRSEQFFEPCMPEAERRRRYEGWLEAVGRAMQRTAHASH